MIETRRVERSTQARSEIPALADHVEIDGVGRTLSQPRQRRERRLDPHDLRNGPRIV